MISGLILIWLLTTRTDVMISWVSTSRCLNTNSCIIISSIGGNIHIQYSWILLSASIHLGLKWSNQLYLIEYSTFLFNFYAFRAHLLEIELKEFFVGVSTANLVLLSSYKWNKILPLFFPCYKERCSWVVKLANVEYFCARAMNIYLINRAGGYHDSWVIFPLTRQITYRANQCLQLYVDHISRRLQFLTSLLSTIP